MAKLYSACAMCVSVPPSCTDSSGCFLSAPYREAEGQSGGGLMAGSDPHMLTPEQ